MTAIPVPRRFSVEHDASRRTFLQFGYGSEENLTGDLIIDPADVVLEVTGRDYTTDSTFDPSNLITNDKFGVTPSNTTLSVIYTANDSVSINAPVGTILNAVTPEMIFQNEASLVKSSVNAVIASLEVENEEPILGDTSDLTPDEIRS